MFLRCALLLVLVVSFITNKHCFLLRSNLRQFWPINYPKSVGSNGIDMMRQDLESLLSLGSSPFQTRNKYNLRGCQRIDNLAKLMNLLMNNERQGYWLYCSQPDIPFKNMFDATLQKSASTSTDISSINHSLSCPFSITKFPDDQFLGKGKFNYLNGQTHVYLACNLTERDFTIIDVS